LNVATLLAAASFAAKRHRDQRRKGEDASPYINHALEVASVLAEAGVTDDQLLVAALLHDTVEDTDTTPAELEQAFGVEVRRLVDEVTDDKSLPRLERKELQVEYARGSSDAAKQLKIADKICNVRDVANSPPAGWAPVRKTEYLAWAVRVVDGCRGVNGSLDRLFDKTLAAARKTLGVAEETASSDGAA